MRPSSRTRCENLRGLHADEPDSEPLSNRARPRAFDAAMCRRARWRRSSLPSEEPARARLRRGRRGRRCRARCRSEVSCSASTSPRPSISIAPREAKWRMRSVTCAGHDALVQRDIASPSGWSTSEPQTGQRSGMTKTRSLPVRDSATGPTTRGITSPARVTKTVSPMRMSLLSMYAALCKVALRIVTPPICTGASEANGLAFRFESR